MSTKKRRPSRPGHHLPKPKPTALSRIQDGYAAFTALPAGKQIGYIAVTLAALTLLLLLIWLVLPKPIALAADGEGNYVDKGHGITYVLAPMQYEPEAWKKKPYGRCKSDDTDFYAISGLDPKRYLASVEGGIGLVWCAADEVGDHGLPDLSGFAPTKIVVCTETETVMALKTIKKEGQAKIVAEAFANGEGVEEIPYANRTLSLKFASSRYPGLFYNLSYMECAEGNFLYDRESKKCVSVGTLLSWYIVREDIAADENSLIGEEETKRNPVTTKGESGTAGGEA